MRKIALVVAAMLLGVAGLAVWQGQTAPEAQTRDAAPQSDLDRLLAPIALYPDQLLAQMLLCAMDPAGVSALDRFLMGNPTLKGTDLQDAAVLANFEPHFVALVLFPSVVTRMATELDWTTRLGQAFTADKSAVFSSIQRLRSQAQEVGALKTTPQQQVETQTTSAGEQVIVIAPANPQVIYVPTYNPQTVYVQSAPATVVVEDNSADAAVAGLIGFTAGVAIGAAVNNNYYYGPYGWHGGGYMYNDAWDDYYDHREDAREDWQDHREDLVEERGERRENVADERGDRAGTTQAQRTERQGNRQENRPETQASGQRATSAQTSTAGARSTGATARGQSDQARTATPERSGTRSDAFSGYSSGSSTRAASSRGQSSRGSSRARSGGGRRR